MKHRENQADISHTNGKFPNMFTSLKNAVLDTMSNEIDPQGFRFDPDEIDASRINDDPIGATILQTLYAEGGSATASQLREEAGVDDTSQIHYRCDHTTSGQAILSEEGLVRHSGTGEWRGRKTREYALTEAGEAFVRTWTPDLPGPAHVADLSRSVSHFERRIEGVEREARDAIHRASDNHTDIRRLTSEMDSKADSSAVNGLKGRVKRIDAKARNRDDDLATAIEGISDELDTIHNQVAELDDAVDRLEDVAEKNAKARRVVGEADEIEEMMVAQTRIIPWLRWINKKVRWLLPDDTDDEAEEKNGRWRLRR